MSHGADITDKGILPQSNDITDHYVILYTLLVTNSIGTIFTSILETVAPIQGPKNGLSLRHGNFNLRFCVKNKTCWPT